MATMNFQRLPSQFMSEQKLEPDMLIYPLMTVLDITSMSRYLNVFLLLFLLRILWKRPGLNQDTEVGGGLTLPPVLFPEQKSVL